MLFFIHHIGIYHIYTYFRYPLKRRRPYSSNFTFTFNLAAPQFAYNLLKLCRQHMLPRISVIKRFFFSLFTFLIFEFFFTSGLSLPVIGNLPFTFCRQQRLMETRPYIWPPDDGTSIWFVYSSIMAPMSTHKMARVRRLCI